MKLCNETVNTLKNFSQINPSVLVEPGSEIVTMAPSKTIIAKVITEEIFDKQMAIYDLSQFLGVVSMLEEPDFDFGEKSVKIKSKNGSVNYNYADPSMIIAPITNSVAMKNVVASFELDRTQFTGIVRAASVLQTDLVKISSTDGKLSVATADSKNDNPHSYEADIEVGDTDGDFAVFVKTENLVKVLPAEYKVTVSDSNVICFQNDTHTYWIVSENRK